MQIFGLIILAVAIVLGVIVSRAAQGGGWLYDDDERNEWDD
jgi:hypothetical protein